MIRRHVLRNALMPTIAVVATQVGYLLGGLVAIEFLFNYQGLGLMTLKAAEQKDFTLLTAGVLVVGVVYLLRDARRRHHVRAAQPAHPLRGGRVSTAAAPAPALGGERRTARAAPAPARGARASSSARDHPLLGRVRDPRRSRITPFDPLFDQTADLSAGAVERALLRHRPPRPRRLLARARRLARHPLVAPARDAARRPIFGTALGLITGYFRGIADDTISRVIDAVLAIPLIVLAVTVVACSGAGRPGR